MGLAEERASSSSLHFPQPQIAQERSLTEAVIICQMHRDWVIYEGTAQKKMLQTNSVHPALDTKVPCSGELWDMAGISFQVNNTSQEVFSTHFWFPFPIVLPTWELKVKSSGISQVLRCGYRHSAVRAASGLVWRHIQKFQVFPVPKPSTAGYRCLMCYPTIWGNWYPNFG